MANYVYIAMSLDGFIADKNGGVDWLHETPPPENDDLGFAEFLSKVDAVIMGRNTYEVILSFGQWPYTVPVFVLSKSLTKIEDNLANKVKLIEGTPKQIMRKLNDLGIQNLYIDGGKTIQSFLNEDLIDEMIITSIPKVLGEGIPLFSSTFQIKKFLAYKTELLSIGAAKTYYRFI